MASVSWWVPLRIDNRFLCHSKSTEKRYGTLLYILLYVPGLERCEGLLTNTTQVKFRVYNGNVGKMIAQWDGSLSVLPVAMIGQWDSSLSVLLGPGSIPNHSGVFQGIFPWLITLCQPILSQRGRKWLNLPSMTPHNLWTARRKAKV